MFLQKVFNRNSERHLSTRKWLEKHGVYIYVVDTEKIESTEDYLKARGVGRSAVIADDLRKAEVEHRIKSRRLVLLSLIVPMSIAPFWLMVLLSLPAFDKKPYPDSMQIAFLAALASDFVGLYYVITRDLFPEGGSSLKSSSKDQENWQHHDQNGNKS